MQDVRFLELHTDLFHAGKNFGKKIKPEMVTGLKLQWDEKEKWFAVTYNGRTGYLFTGNCAFWEPNEGVVESPKNEHRTENVEGRKRAQVSTPMGHVFEGPGKGKVNDRAGNKNI